MTGTDNGLPLRYGMNPHQAPARAYVRDGRLPLRVLNGAPSYINLLDALNAWQLVRELQAATGIPAATSFKHATPTGAALGLPMTPTLARACRVEDLELSPLASAYARARGADRVASFGDFVAVSELVDLSTARLFSREVSDGIIAPDYDPEALSLLRRKKGGKYLVLSIDEGWEPGLVERREVFGIALEQPRNFEPVPVGSIVTERQDLVDSAARDLLLAAITLKYTPSNSVCLAVDGQAIGVGAGQQSRIHCTRLACGKAETWWLRQHPRALALEHRRGLSRPDWDNAVDLWLRNEHSLEVLVDMPEPLAPEERENWVATLRGVALASDGLIPFRDNIDRAAQTGVEYVWQPGGSGRDEEVVAAADRHSMVMCFSGHRLFHH